jgi:nucleoid DNA-binding protein
MRGERNSVKRVDFINNIVRDQNLTYVQASAAWDSFIKTIDDGICAGCKIQFGKVGTIVPVRYDPRIVQMGCRRVKSGEPAESASRTYFLGSRIKFKFRLFKGFLNSRTMDWKL